MSLQLGGNGGISGCTSLHQPISNLSSLVVDGDTSISGETLFNGLTTHAAGVSVTGGGIDLNGDGDTSDIYYNDVADGIWVTKYLNPRKHVTISNTSSPQTRQTLATYSTVDASLVTNQSSPGAGTTGTQSYLSLGSGTTTHVSHFVANNSNNSQNLNVQNYYGFVSEGIRHAANNYNFYSAGGASSGSTSNYGFYSAGLSYSATLDYNNYNFYAEGSAPNYFFAGLLAGSDTWDNTTNAAQLEGGRVRVAKSSGRPVTESPFEVYRQNTSGSEPYYLLMYLNGETTGVLKLNNSDQPGLHDISDYRLKSNIAELQDATSLVKQLKPCTFSIRNHNNVRGFVAHELQEIAPECVSGTKDATESIGTLIDWDGTELDTEVTEPIPEDLTYEEQVEVTPYIPAVAATYDEYGNELTAEVPEVEATYTTVTRTRTWTPTGTRPVYQGVDQTKLIPLLTKALQEALDKIETLETRLSDAGIA